MKELILVKRKRRLLKRSEMNKLKSYEQGFLTHVEAPMLEEEIKEKFRVFGEVKKIEHTNKQRIFDFIIEETRMLIEVTSTNLISPFSLRTPFNQRIKRAIKHITQKKKYDGFKTIGIIFTDVAHEYFKNPSEKDYQTDMKNKGIDCLIIICKNASINRASSRSIYSTKIFFSNPSKFTQEEENTIKKKVI